MAEIHTHDRSDEVVATDASATTTSPTLLDKAIAVLRIAFGITFLWAFFDKLLALGFSTGAVTNPETGARDSIDFFAKDAAWLNGGSPTEGFLTFAVPADNPFKEVFTSMAGQTWVDGLFMLGLLGIGVSLLTGVAMRIGTAAGALMYAFMYAAVLPLENNPIVDVHLLGVISMAVVGLAYAGRTWGLGTWWESQSIVKRNPALR